MTTRGQCPVCYGTYAVAADGTPYKHNTPGADTVCPGADEQALPVPQWLVYGGEIQILQHPVVIQQISSEAEGLPEIDYADDQVLQLLGSFDHEPTPAEIQDLVPEQWHITLPPGPDVSETPG